MDDTARIHVWWISDWLWRPKKNAPRGKQGYQKEKACISKETFINVFICYSVSPVQIRQSDNPIHRKPVSECPISSQRQRWKTTLSDFKTPLTTVTTVENSVIGNTAAPKRISSKLEVNPDKTDKTNADVKDMYFDLFHRLSSDQILEENYFDEKKYSVKSNCNVNPQVSIKGKLKNNLDYWENAIGAKRVVTSAIKEGHNIPFTYTPKKAHFKN